MLTMKFAVSNLKRNLLCTQLSSTVFGINSVTSKCLQNKCVYSLSRVVKNPGFLKKKQPTRVFCGILKFNLVDHTGFFSFCFICKYAVIRELYVKRLETIHYSYIT